MVAYIVTKSVTAGGQTNKNNADLYVCDAASAPAAVTAAVTNVGGVASEWTATAIANTVSAIAKLRATPSLV